MNNELIIAQAEQYRPCVNFETCGNLVPKPSSGPWSERCPECRAERRRSQDAARQRAKRQPRFEAEEEPEAEAPPERLVRAYQLEREWYGAWLEGEPFWVQLPIATASLDELRPEGLPELSAPRWCTCAVHRGHQFLAGTIITPGAICASCGHELSPNLLRPHGRYIGAGPYSLRSRNQDLWTPRR